MKTMNMKEMIETKKSEWKKKIKSKIEEHIEKDIEELSEGKSKLKFKKGNLEIGNTVQQDKDD